MRPPLTGRGVLTHDKSFQPDLGGGGREDLHSLVQKEGGGGGEKGRGDPT